MVTVKVRGIIYQSTSERDQTVLSHYYHLHIISTTKCKKGRHVSSKDKTEFQSKKHQPKHYEFIAGLFHLLCGSLTQMGMKGKFMKGIDTQIRRRIEFIS